MTSAIRHLAPVALVITIGCGSNASVPTAPGAGSAGVTAEKESPRPGGPTRKSVAQPVKPVSPGVFFD